MYMQPLHDDMTLWSSLGGSILLKKVYQCKTISNQTPQTLVCRKAQSSQSPLVKYQRKEKKPFTLTMAAYNRARKFKVNTLA